VYRWVDEQVIETMHRRMLEQPEKVKKRKELVEHPFGTIKRSMNQGYFLMRGRAKVSAEVSLSVLAYNIKRVLNIIGLPKLVEAIKTLMGGPMRSVCHFFCSIDPRAEQIL
jgi:hypothetical protein